MHFVVTPTKLWVDFTSWRASFLTLVHTDEVLADAWREALVLS
jgi:hypothetical protein